MYIFCMYVFCVYILYVLSGCPSQCTTVQSKRHYHCLPRQHREVNRALYLISLHWDVLLV